MPEFWPDSIKVFIHNINIDHPVTNQLESSRLLVPNRNWTENTTCQLAENTKKKWSVELENFNEIHPREAWQLPSFALLQTALAGL